MNTHQANKDSSNNTEPPVFSILIVDDDMDDHLFLKSALMEVLPKASVKSLYDGSEAIDYLNLCGTLPNLIFLDLNMTKLSGKTTTRLIRGNQRLTNIPLIILTTSKGWGQEKKELIELGASEFYTKPSSHPDLVKIVQSVQKNWLKKLN